jgi:HK97 family phage major capsid protein
MKKATRRKEQIVLCVVATGGRLPATLGDVPRAIREGWQDLVMLRWQIPMNFPDGGSYFMNQHTWALCSTMSDANGRPIMTMTPGDAAPFRIGGAPVVIASQMLDVAAGSTPVAYGNWKQNHAGIAFWSARPFHGVASALILHLHWDR